VVRRDDAITGFIVHFREVAMSFGWSEYLKVARELAGQPTDLPSPEAKKRCAISRAYYAAFCSARNYLRDKDNDPDIPVGGNAHGYVRRQFKISKDRVRREIGEYLARLVAKRNIVDYDDEIADLPNLDDETYLALNWSQQVISDLSRLQSN
jgi:uncharacterized protein (UPF0332 family)